MTGREGCFVSVSHMKKGTSLPNVALSQIHWYFANIIINVNSLCNCVSLLAASS